MPIATSTAPCWDERAPAHAASPDYHVDRFAADPAYLSEVVAFDRPLLGPIEGLRGVHLQCHIGTDTVSLARLGARITGLDFSPASLAEARPARRRGRRRRRLRRGERRRRPDVLGAGAFDLVYTGIGALIWLPDIDRWAAVVAELLRPGGRLFMREGHPMLWALDDEPRRRAAGRSSTRTSSTPSRRSGTSPAPTSATDDEFSQRPSATSGTTAWARSSRRCSTTACS